LSEDSDTNLDTTASSIAGDTTFDGRKRRTEASQLRKSVFGKKHRNLDESKVGLPGVGVVGKLADYPVLGTGG